MASSGKDTTPAIDAASARTRQPVGAHPDLIKAAHYLYEDKLALAEPICREFLKKDPTNVSAIRLLAQIGIRVGRYEGAENLLVRCLELAPDFTLARQNYATVLSKRRKHTEALEQVEKILAVEPNSPEMLSLKANSLADLGQFDQAIETYENLLAQYPNQGGVQLSYGHTLKTVGRQKDAIEAYRACIKINSHTGVAYWSLANLKTFRFEDPEIAAMKEDMAAEKLEATEYFHLCFSLGKALEDRKDYDPAFKAYYKGNYVRRKTVHYDAAKNHRQTQEIKEFFTADFFAKAADKGCQKPDPIFIVGLPRSGSTLLEQILASHSAVEGTMELPDIISISHRIGGSPKGDEPSQYPAILADLSGDQLKKLGEEYIERTRIHRSGKEFFIDKMPNNFSHIGLILAILPNAKIIDARRHPLGCCFSGFKQLFAQGQNFTYDIEEIGRYYRDYVDLMDHFDQVLPGRVLRVHYENVVNDTETQVRRLLNYCGLEFEEQCLRFYETDRAVRTASSEQVRQPIQKTSVEHWRHFEDYLGPLKFALGDLMDKYPC